MREIWTFCHFVTSERFSSLLVKHQNYHNSPGSTLITKMSAFFPLQLLKLKKIKSHYFLDPTSFEGDMSILSFSDFMEMQGHPLTSNQVSKSSYLNQMTSDSKNKGTLFPSTLKVEGNNVPLFFWSDIIWRRYELFVILWFHKDAGAPPCK